MDCKLVPTIGLILTLIFASPSALAAEWIVQRSSGDVSFLRGGVTPASLSSQETVMPGDRVATGKTGRVMLVRGAEYILISPGSELIVPDTQGAKSGTLLLQTVGEISFEVEKRNVRHFEVRTPWLAAIVKGTRFTVRADKFGSSVFVDRGIVEVFDFDTYQVALLHAGQTARTAAIRGAGLSLSGQGVLAIIKRREPGASEFDADSGSYSQALNGFGTVDGTAGWGGLDVGAGLSGGASALGGLGGGVSAGASTSGSGGLGAGASVSTGTSGHGGLGAGLSGGLGGLGVGVSLGK